MSNLSYLPLSSPATFLEYWFNFVFFSRYGIAIVHGSCDCLIIALGIHELSSVVFIGFVIDVRIGLLFCIWIFFNPITTFLISSFVHILMHFGSHFL